MSTEHFINSNYSKDVLGEDFEQCTLDLKDDYEGKVLATLVRRKSKIPTFKAVLYVHGFNDYFFQKELAKRFNAKGYNFYALDLRKYGRSLLKHQKMNNVRSLLEYDEEIERSLDIIRSEENKQVILMGHSTGGLILTYYAGRNLHSEKFQGVICNSPFYSFNLNSIERKLGIPMLSFIGRHKPDLLISSGFTKLYGYSLHQEKYGEWEYSLTWKPHKIPKVNLGFINAIHKAQKQVHHHTTIDVPMLILHSSRSIYTKEWVNDMQKGDAVLNIDDIHKYGKALEGDITLCTIKDGMHDLILSPLPVREEAYKQIFLWIDLQYGK